MKSFFKNKAVSIIILLATLVLAGIAVFTAIRLYQLRQESVAPTAPTSEPEAADGSASLNQCSPLTFTIEGAPSLAPGECALSAVPSSLSMQVGETKTTLITISGDPGDLVLTAEDESVVEVDLGNPQSCFLPPCPINVEVTALKVGTTTVNVSGTPSGSAQTCQVPVNVTVLAPGQSPSPSPSPSPSASPSGSPLALTSPSVSPSPTASPTPPASCNNSCSTNSDCESGLVCSNGACKNSSCAADSDCICATATPTPSGASTAPSAGGSSAPVAQGSPAPELPDAGVSTPTIIGIGFGILLILGALLLAL